MSPAETTKLTQLLNDIDQRISAAQDLVVTLRVKRVPAEDAEQMLWTLIALRRAYQRRLEPSRS
jgi:hypothetical protein